MSLHFNVHCYFLKVMEDDQEIAAYMFRRTVPSMHLTPEDVRWMVCFGLNLIFQCLPFASTYF
jgi:hypothetical protein